MKRLLTIMTSTKLISGKKKIMQIFITLTILILSVINCTAQYRPSLFFREDWIGSKCMENQFSDNSPLL